MIQSAWNFSTKMFPGSLRLWTLKPRSTRITQANSKRVRFEIRPHSNDNRVVPGDFDKSLLGEILRLQLMRRLRYYDLAAAAASQIVARTEIVGRSRLCAPVPILNPVHPHANDIFMNLKEK